MREPRQASDGARVGEATQGQHDGGRGNCAEQIPGNHVGGVVLADVDAGDAEEWIRALLAG